jgi:hypothetical protein
MAIAFAAQSCGDGDDPAPTSTPAAARELPPFVADPPWVPEAGAVVDAGFDPAGYLGVGALCEDAGLACPPGYACCAPCCLSGQPPICTPLSDRGDCPFPDLTVDSVALGQSLVVDSLEAGTCEIVEACLGGGGLRRVLRFDVRVANQGSADLVLGSPREGPGFQYSACHGHYHFNDFASYRLLDVAGNAVLIGRKQAFCARDSERVDPKVGSQPTYDCNFQGISRGWDDDYDKSLPCQWLDVSDVAPGSYVLEVEANPVRKITELDYGNNLVRVPVVIP